MAALSGSYLLTSAMQTFSANLFTCRRKVSINAMSQNDPAAFTLNDVSQLIYFFSYTACCPRQTNNGHYFLPTIFRNIKVNLLYKLPDWPSKKFKFANPNFVYDYL